MRTFFRILENSCFIWHFGNVNVNVRLCECVHTRSTISFLDISLYFRFSNILVRLYVHPYCKLDYQLRMLACLPAFTTMCYVVSKLWEYFVCKLCINLLSKTFGITNKKHGWRRVHKKQLLANNQ